MNVLVEELTHPLLVELEINVLLVPLADRRSELLETPQIVFVGFDRVLVFRIVHPVRRRQGNGQVPGKLSQALGIELDLNDTSLLDGPVAIEPRHPDWRDVRCVAGERIGITKAVDLEWRFCALGSRSVSRPWPAELREALVSRA